MRKFAISAGCTAPALALLLGIGWFLLPGGLKAGWALCMPWDDLCEVRPGKVALPEDPAPVREIPVPGSRDSSERGAQDGSLPAFGGFEGIEDVRAKAGAHLPDFPKLPLPAQPKGHEAEVVLTSTAVVSPTNIWVVGSIRSWICCDFMNHHDLVAFHYDGTAWRNLAPDIPGTDLTHAVPDGSGGLWIGTNRPYLLHHSDGTWRKVRFPVKDHRSAWQSPNWHVAVLEQLPGTSALLVGLDSNDTMPTRYFAIG